MTPRYRALGHDFAFQVDDPEVAGLLGRLYAPFACDGPPAALYSLARRRTDGSDLYELSFGGDIIGRHRAWHTALGRLVWHINRQVIECTADRLLIHGAAAERGRLAILLPAPMSSGKTTLVAGLVRAGWRYLTDETIAIDPKSLLVHPYPKPLSIDKGSWQVLADLDPRTEQQAAFFSGQWQVQPADIRPDAIACPSRVALVVSPRYQRGAATRAEPVSRAEMLTELGNNTFNFLRAPERNLDTLGAMLRGSPCYRLTVGDLDTACAIVTDLFDRSIA